MARSFDTAIGSAHTPLPGSRPGRIRTWLAILGLLLVVGHIALADPLARLRADLRMMGQACPATITGEE